MHIGSRCVICDVCRLAVERDFERATGDPGGQRHRLLLVQSCETVLPRGDYGWCGAHDQTRPVDGQFGDVRVGQGSLEVDRNVANDNRGVVHRVHGDHYRRHILLWSAAAGVTQVVHDDRQSVVAIVVLRIVPVGQPARISQRIGDLGQRAAENDAVGAVADALEIGCDQSAGNDFTECQSAVDDGHRDLDVRGQRIGIHDTNAANRQRHVLVGDLRTGNGDYRRLVGYDHDTVVFHFAVRGQASRRQPALAADAEAGIRFAWSGSRRHLYHHHVPSGDQRLAREYILELVDPVAVAIEIDPSVQVSGGRRRDRDWHGRAGCEHAIEPDAVFVVAVHRDLAAAQVNHIHAKAGATDRRNDRVGNLVRRAGRQIIDRDIAR